MFALVDWNPAVHHHGFLVLEHARQSGVRDFLTGNQADCSAESTGSVMEIRTCGRLAGGLLQGLPGQAGAPLRWWSPEPPWTCCGRRSCARRSLGRCPSRFYRHLVRFQLCFGILSPFLLCAQENVRTHAPFVSRSSMTTPWKLK